MEIASLSNTKTFTGKTKESTYELLSTKKRNSKGSTSISQTPENKIAMDEDEEHSIVGCAIENTPENKIAMDEDEEHSIVGCAIENTPENKIAMDEDEEHSIVGCAIENTPENKIAMDEDEEHSIVGCAIKKIRYVDVMDNQSSNDEVKHEMLYDMCGYLVKTRDSVWIHCPNCKKGLITKYEDLPSTFLSADYTADRNHGGLTFVTGERTINSITLAERWKKPAKYAAMPRRNLVFFCIGATLKPK
ncbi:hypothetical protein OUZ56_007699 [Daphnia magna]|uniref:Uncharacterized protein n=1 Tax=Daphnia magna TaxID=35525 RepID=A0ABR0AAR1_9CRUS|nr:hypothetical protein OUZ56_007699 [Daphnia magna]